MELKYKCADRNPKPGTEKSRISRRDEEKGNHSPKLVSKHIPSTPQRHRTHQGQIEVCLRILCQAHLQIAGGSMTRICMAQSPEAIWNGWRVLGLNINTELLHSDIVYSAGMPSISLPLTFFALDTQMWAQFPPHSISSGAYRWKRARRMETHRLITGRRYENIELRGDSRPHPHCRSAALTAPQTWAVSLFQLGGGRSEAEVLLKLRSTYDTWGFPPLQDWKV